jgi:hypothetical protein
VAGPIAELVRGGGIDPRFPSQENGETEEDANSDEAEIPAIRNYVETGSHASALTTRKRKSKGKSQIAKGKSKAEKKVKRQNAKCKRQKYNPKNDFPG